MRKQLSPSFRKHRFFGNPVSELKIGIGKPVFQETGLLRTLLKNRFEGKPVSWDLLLKNGFPSFRKAVSRKSPPQKTVIRDRFLEENLETGSREAEPISVFSLEFSISVFKKPEFRDLYPGAVRTSHDLPAALSAL